MFNRKLFSSWFIPSRLKHLETYVSSSYLADTKLANLLVTVVQS